MTLGSTVMVRVDGVGDVTVVGLNEVVMPVGEDAVRSTGLLKPPTGVMPIVEVLEPPAVIVREVGLVDKLKSGPTTATSTIVSLETKPDMPALLPEMSTE